MDTNNVKRWITEPLEKIYSKRTTQLLRYLIVLAIVWMILFTPFQMAGQASTQTSISSIIPQPEQASGQALYRAIYRGIKRSFLPNVPDEIANPVYQQWSSMDEIYNGLALLQNISALNPNQPSLMATYIGNQTVQKFTQTVFLARSNTTDLWWGDLDKTVEAATILQELGVLGYKIGQLDILLNYTLQLSDYYSQVAPPIATVDNITIPGIYRNV